MAAAMIKAVKFAKTIKAYFYHTRATTAAKSGGDGVQQTEQRAHSQKS